MSFSELQKVGILVSRIPDISGRKSGHFQIVAANLSIFGYNTIDFVSNFGKIQQIHNLDNLIKNLDTGRKMSFFYSAVFITLLFVE